MRWSDRWTSWRRSSERPEPRGYPPNKVSSGSRAPRSTARSTSTQDDTACLREHTGLGLDRLGGKHPTATLQPGRGADPLQIAGELLHGLDRPDPLYLHRHVGIGVVTTHEVHRADVRRPLPPDEPQPLAAPSGLRSEKLLELALHALLLQRGRLAHIVAEVGDRLGDADIELLLGAALAHHDASGLLLDHGRRGHPVLGLEAAAVRMHHHGAVRLQHQQAQRLGKHGGETAGVDHLAAGDDQAHEQDGMGGAGRRSWSRFSPPGVGISRAWAFSTRSPAGQRRRPVT